MQLPVFNLFMRFSNTIVYNDKVAHTELGQPNIAQTIGYKASKTLTWQSVLVDNWLNGVTGEVISHKDVHEKPILYLMEVWKSREEGQEQ